jgi:hypothetical protein
MLEHSLPLPLTIFYYCTYREMTAEDEDGALLALSHRDRVRHIALWMPYPKVGKFMTAIDEQFPKLERLFIGYHTEDSGVTLRNLVFPVTFQAPNPCQVRLRHIPRPTVRPLVVLQLTNIPAFAYFPPSRLLTQLSLVPQLQRLDIGFRFPPHSDVDETPHNLSMTQVTFPNLRYFWFFGSSAYLEGFVAQISTPVLSNLQIHFFSQSTFVIPRLLHFVCTQENLSFRAAWLGFPTEGLTLETEYLGRSIMSFNLKILPENVNTQVSSTVQILSALQPVLSGVERLTLRYEGRVRPIAKWNKPEDLTRGYWHDLLRPFSNVKTLYVQSGLVLNVAPFLRRGHGQPPMGVLPNLKELGYPGGSCFRGAFVSLAGHSINVVDVDNSVFWQT